MYKPNNKKMLTVLISIAMVFSALAVLSIAAQPAYATAGNASGSFSVLPSTVPAYAAGSLGTIEVQLPVFAISSSAVSAPASSILYLWWSTTNTASPSGTYYYAGEISSTASGTVNVGTNWISQYYLTANTIPGTLTNNYGTPTTAGTYYLLITAGATVPTTAVGVAVSSPITVSSTVVPPNLAISLEKSTLTATTNTETLPTSLSVTVGQTVYFEGSGYVGTSVSLYLNNIANGTALTTASVTSTSISGSFTVPELPAGSYYVIAYDASGTGTTAIEEITVGPAVTYSGSIPANTLSFSLTISGTGFVAGNAIGAFTSSSPLSSASITLTEVAAPTTVYYAYTTGGTVSSNGAVTLTVTGVETAVGTPAPIVTPGTYHVKVFYTTSTPALSPYFPNPVYVSEPYVSPHLSVVLTSDLTTIHGYPGQGITVTVSGFPASSPVSVSFGPESLTLTTDVNGFAQTQTTVPYAPALLYTVTAVSQGVSATAQFTITFEENAYASNGALLNGQYAVAGSAVTISLAGASAYGTYDFVDSGLVTWDNLLINLLGYYTAPPGFVSGSLAWNNYLGITSVTVTNGTFLAPPSVSTPTFEANGNGVLTITYNLAYHVVTTGTPETIKQSSTTIGSYDTVGHATVAPTATSYAPQTVATVAVGNFIPAGSLITPETAGYTSPFVLELNGNVLTLSTGKTTFTSSASVVSFTLPASVSDGIYTLSVVGQSGSGKTVGSYYWFAVSTAGTTGATVTIDQADISTLSGTGTYSSPFMVYADPASDYYDLAFNGYNFPSGTTVTVTMYSSVGSSEMSTTVTTGPQGAFTALILEIPGTSGNSPYLVMFSATSSGKSIPISGSMWYYQTVPVVSYLDAPFFGNGGSPITDYYIYTGSNAAAGSPVTFYATSLLPDTIYNVYYGSSTTINASNYITSFTTDIYGNYTVTFTVPVYLSSGTYYLDVAPASSSATTASLYLTLEVSQLVPAYAFPTEEVPYSISLGTSLPYSNIVYYDVQAMENGSVFQSLQVPVTTGSQSPADHYLNFSFSMPNDQAGTYFQLSFQYEPVFTGTVVGSSGSATVTGVGSSATSTVSYYTTLVAGSGALVVAISSSQIASIITTTINQAMSVPLSQLDATVASLNGTVATLKTAFGTMTATLSAINATVASIESGQVIVQTDLGSISTSLASLNASLMAFNGNVVLINTTLGQVQTSLSSIGTQVTANANGIATIKTDVGTIQGQVVSTNGNVSQIKTSLGTLTANVSTIQKQTSGFPTLEIFLIVIIVLVLITLVVAFLAVSAANKAARRATEEKKQ